MTRFTYLFLEGVRKDGLDSSRLASCASRSASREDPSIKPSKVWLIIRQELDGVTLEVGGGPWSLGDAVLGSARQRPKARVLLRHIIEECRPLTDRIALVSVESEDEPRESWPEPVVHTSPDEAADFCRRREGAFVWIQT
jgi:hypothetical protein